MTFSKQKKNCVNKLFTEILSKRVEILSKKTTTVCVNRYGILIKKKKK